MMIPDLTSTDYKLRKLANYFAIRYNSIMKCRKEGHIKESSKSSYVCKRCGLAVHPARAKTRKLRIKIGDLLNEGSTFKGLNKYNLTMSEINLILHKLRSGDFKIVGR